MDRIQDNHNSHVGTSNEEELEDMAMERYEEAQKELVQVLQSLQWERDQHNHEIERFSAAAAAVEADVAGAGHDREYEVETDFPNGVSTTLWRERRYSHDSDYLEVLFWLARNEFCQGLRQKAFASLLRAKKLVVENASGCYGSQHPLLVVVLVQLASIRRQQSKIAGHKEEAAALMLQA